MNFTPSLVASGAARRVWFVFSSGGLVVREQGGEVTLPGDDDAGALGLDVSSVKHLGRLDDADAVAAWLEHDRALPATYATRGLRSLFGAVPDEVHAVAGRAAQVLEWAQTTRHCGRCAALTACVEGELCARCPACGLSAYPRIAPAIIVLVRRGDEALLARGARFPEAFYSTLAGFSDVGESLEETLAREVREEVGVEVKNVRYFGSQPWPFPHSLMVGFTADWAGGEIQVDGQEIVDARWFRPESLPMLPGRMSIARKLIDAWVHEVLGPGAGVGDVRLARAAGVRRRCFPGGFPR
jgi:NAD+ diphosphatase